MALIRRFTERLRERRDRRATLRELCRLSPRQLCDIGIEPDQIEAVVDGLLRAQREPVERSGQEGPEHAVGKRAEEESRVARPLRVSDRCC